MKCGFLIVDPLIFGHVMMLTTSPGQHRRGHRLVVNSFVRCILLIPPITPNSATCLR